MISILVYPNITYMKDIEKDSYVIVLHNIIKELNKIRNDLEFTILSPKFIQLLKFDNTRQIPIQLPSYPNQMRTHFNSSLLLKSIDWQNNDYDIVYSHLPEHTLALKNMFYNTTNITPKFIGYSHWFEVDENTNYSKTMLLSNICGMLCMDECGVNSKWLKSLILDKAKKEFNLRVIKKLDNIIQPHYLGIDTIKQCNKYKPKTILFNHRPNEYTGWKWFLNITDNLWNERKDFVVYTTLVDDNRPYIKHIKISNRKQYLETIGNMYIGVGCFQKYSAWSIATTDGLSQGIPYLLPNKFCYPEMVGTDYPLLYNNSTDFRNILTNILDNDTLRNITNCYINTILDDLLWENRIKHWFNNWDFTKLPIIGDTNSYNKLFNLIKKHKNISKKNLLALMGWGIQIKFSRYRNRLRRDGIKVYRNRYEY